MLKEINYLRFFFCLAVFFVHWHGRISAELQSQLSYLYRVHFAINVTPIHFAVIGFIVLSGFCIHISSHALFKTPLGIAKYFIRRAFRILPVLFLGMAMAVGMYYFYPDNTVSWWGYVRNFNGPLLTVMLEVLLYILYVPLILWLQKQPKIAFIFICFVSFIGIWSAFYTTNIWRFYPKENWPFDLPYHSLMGYFPYWWMGAGAAHIYLNSQSFKRFLSFKLHIPLFATTVAVCLAYTFYFEGYYANDPLGMTLYQLGYMVVYALTIAAFLASAHRKATSKHEVSHYLQMPAYSLYAIHYPLLFLWPNTLWTFAGTIILSYIVYFILEKPTQDYGIHLTRRLVQ